MTTVHTQSAKALLADSNYGPARKVETITGATAHISGTILGRVTATGFLAPYLSTNSDGSEVAICVLLEDADTTSADLTAVVGFAGIYVESNMIGLDAEGATALEARAIYFK